MNIRLLREKANLTQSQLAEKLKVHQTTVAKWETTDTCPTGRLIPQIAEVLNCSIDDLYGEGNET